MVPDKVPSLMYSKRFSLVAFLQWPAKLVSVNFISFEQYHLQIPQGEILKWDRMSVLSDEFIARNSIIISSYFVEFMEISGSSVGKGMMEGGILPIVIPCPPAVPAPPPRAGDTECIRIITSPSTLISSPPSH